MKYVRVEPLSDMYGYLHDPQKYLAELPNFLGDLPSGAAAFAASPGHYDFQDVQCIKDLTIGRLSFIDDGDQLSIEVYFEPNEWKHDDGLLIRYLDVYNFDVQVGERGQGHKRFGSVQLDEILPHASGCSHELVLTGGSIIVVCSDLVAIWGVDSWPNESSKSPAGST